MRNMYIDNVNKEDINGPRWEQKRVVIMAITNTNIVWDTICKKQFERSVQTLGMTMTTASNILQGSCPGV